MLERVKFALVGCGSIGSRHLSILRGLQSAEVVAVCDVDQVRLQETSTVLGGIQTYVDFDQVLQATDADVIDVCTPHYLHAPMAIAAAQANRNVLVEKPMALSITDCERMIEAAQLGGVRLWVVKQNRFNIPVKLVGEALQLGWLGRILMVECNVLWNRRGEYYANSPWRGRKEQEGGALFTQVSHFIDLLVWWFGDVVTAKGFVATRCHNIEIEDCGSASVEFSSGVLGTIVWTTCVCTKNYEGSITILGENGTVKIGGEYLNKMEFWDVKGHPLPQDVVFDDKPNCYGTYQGTSSNHDQVLDRVVSDLKYDRHEVVEGSEGKRAVQAIEMIYRSSVVCR